MKQTFKITFYPGMVLPRPYFVTTEDTTDYSAVMDILADRLTEEGSDGLFDDNEELSDDQVTICGNECRRLITGGILNILKLPVDIVTVADYLREIMGLSESFGNVLIGFRNSDGEDDETELSGFSVDEVAEVLIEFCKENDCSPFDLLYVERKYGGIQYATERGLVYVVGECTADAAVEHGFSYAFSSDGNKFYSKIVGTNRRQFVIGE